MNKIAAITALLAVALLLTPATSRADDDDKVDLKLRLEKGQEYKLIVTTEQHIVQWIMDNEMEIDQTMVFGETLKITDVDQDGTYTIDVTIGPVAMKMDMPMGSFEFDSEDPPDEVPVMARGIAALADQAFTLKMTPHGKVVEVSGIDDMFESMMDAFDDLDESMRDQMIEDMKKQFGDDGIKEMMEHVTPVYPDDPISVGDSWEQKVVMARAFPLIAETTYTLAERKDGVATLEIEGSFEPNPDGEPMKMGPMTMKIKLKGTQEGTFEIDEATGWFIEGEMIQKMEGEVVMSGGPGGEGITVPMRVKSTITFTTE